MLTTLQLWEHIFQKPIIQCLIDHMYVEKTRLCNFILFPKENIDFNNMSNFFFRFHKKNNKNGKFSQVFIEENKCVASNEISIYDLKSHNKVIMWISLWATATKIVWCKIKKKLLNNWFQEKCGYLHFYDVKLTLWKSKAVIICRFLIVGYYGNKRRHFCNILK